MEPKEKIAEVIPAVKLPAGVASAFSYAVPPALAAKVRVGSVVRIPFRKKEIQGVVCAFREEPAAFKLKAIREVEDSLFFSASQLELARYISAYYSTPLSLVIRLMLVEVPKRDPRTAIHLAEEIRDQNSAEPPTEEVAAFLEGHGRTLLLHNLGAERHNLYAALAEREKGQTMVMVPEYFDLFTQAPRYLSFFGKEKVALLCSDLTKNQFYQEWCKVQSGQARIILGTRQAIFAPFTDLSLLIVDDEHDSSYKQWDQNPRYHGVTGALELARLHTARLLLSSPTPSLESYQRTREDFSLLDLSQRPAKGPFIVDFSTERRLGNPSFISERLRELLFERIYAKEQALILIPRLGEKTVYQCKDCGHIAECEVCQSALIGYKNNLYCPRCKELHDSLIACPSCRGQNISAYGGGSQRAFAELEAQFEFKNIRIQELDSSTSQDGNRNQKTFEDFRAGRIDILVGTQMAWKGWDMPRLRVIAVIFPEIIFNSPGFRSKERSWQFLSDLYRYAQEKEVIVETYKPEHKYFSEFRATAMEDFLKAECENRRLSLTGIPYPPFGKLIKLIYKHPDARTCEKEARWQHQLLQDAIYDLELRGRAEVFPPFPAQSYREYGKYRWHLVLRHALDLPLGERDRLLARIKENWITDVDPDDIL